MVKWNEYKDNVLQWQGRTELARHAKNVEVERHDGDMIDAQLDTRLPCSEIATESTLGVHFCKVVSKHGQRPMVHPPPALSKSTGWTFFTILWLPLQPQCYDRIVQDE